VKAGASAGNTNKSCPVFNFNRKKEMNTLFMHYRPVDANGAIGDPRGGATVAIRETGEGEVNISIAFCNPQDVFNRAVGRAVAEGRLNAKLAGKDVNGFFGVVPVKEDSACIKDNVHKYVQQTMELCGYY
jgi:hypothetical protein